MSTAGDKALLTIKAADIISVSAAPRKVMQGPLFHPTLCCMPISGEESVLVNSFNEQR